MSKIGSHVLSIDQFSRAELENLLQIAKRLEPVAQRKVNCRVLEGALMANLFFEASTRTRLSFHAAFSRLGGQVCDTTGFTFSSISKGESISDTARVIAGYADVIVMRHPDVGSVAEFAANINIPVINAGDGIGEHPSQALLDYYTIEKEFSRLGKSIDGMTIAMVGDLKHGRTIHSLAKLLAKFKDINFKFISPDIFRIPQEIIDELHKSGHKVAEFDNLQSALHDVDVIYATRIQRERIEDGELLEGYAEALRLNRKNIINHAPQDVVILHPLPRDSRVGAFDLSSDLDELQQLAIFRQADNGVTIRMAIFADILGVSKNIEDYFISRNLYRPNCYGKNDFFTIDGDKV